MRKVLWIVGIWTLMTIGCMGASLPKEITVGNLKQSITTLHMGEEKFSLYEALGTTYIPVASLRRMGCDVSYDSKTGDIKVVCGEVNSDTRAKEEAVKIGKYSLYTGNIYLEGMESYGITSEGRVYVPLEAIQGMYDIKRDMLSDKGIGAYEIVPKEKIPVRVSERQVCNDTPVPINVEVVDVYWNKGIKTVSTSYVVEANQTIQRQESSLGEHVGTYAKHIESGPVVFEANTTYGQLDGKVYAARDKRLTIPKNMGDTIALSSMLKAEDTVNDKGFSSKTKYLVWTNIDQQRTYIFQGEQGNWDLIKTFICSTGRDYTPTPKGEYALTRKVPYFGVEKGYRCKNAFGFIGTTYLYHSIIFNKEGTRLLEGRGVLGTKASQGCIRFSEENSKWFYDNMLSGTKVWIN